VPDRTKSSCAFVTSIHYGPRRRWPCLSARTSAIAVSKTAHLTIYVHLLIFRHSVGYSSQLMISGCSVTTSWVKAAVNIVGHRIHSGLWKQQACAF